MEMLGGIKVSIPKKANEKGHLFEKIHNEEIVEALLEQAKIRLETDHLVIDEPIKEIGEYKVGVEVGNNKGFFVLTVNAY